MNKWSYVLFDMDGTLIDSAHMVTRRFANTFEHFGIPIPNAIELHSLVGPSAASTMERFLPEEKVQDGLNYYRYLAMKDGVSGLLPFQGIRELLDQLKLSGLILGVATSKPEEEAISILKHLDLIDYFSTVSGASDILGIHKKSDVINVALKRLAPGSFNEVVMVGDRIYDIEGAQNCGIDSIFVSWGGASNNEGANATVVAETPLAVQNVIIGNGNND